MPPSRSHDPFNDAPRRPASQTQTHYDTQTTDNDPTRRNNLFASSLSRRPPPLHPLQNPRQPASPVHEDDSADDSLAHIASAPSYTRTNTSTTQLASSTNARPTTRTRARRKAAPPSASANGLNIFSPTPEPLNPDIVVRGKDGSYISPVPELGEQIHGTAAERVADDARYNASIADFWARSGGSGALLLPSPGAVRDGRPRRVVIDRAAGETGDELGIGRITQGEEQMWGRLSGDVMGRLREAVGEKLSDERWLFERTDVMEALNVANHGRM